VPEILLLKSELMPNVGFVFRTVVGRSKGTYMYLHYHFHGNKLLLKTNNGVCRSQYMMFAKCYITVMNLCTFIVLCILYSTVPDVQKCGRVKRQEAGEATALKWA
jgi:hypothetical protein